MKKLITHLAITLLKILSNEAPRGWVRSKRPPDLKGT